MRLVQLVVDQSWLRKFGRWHKWISCLTAARELQTMPIPQCIHVADARCGCMSGMMC